GMRPALLCLLACSLVGCGDSQSFITATGPQPTTAPGLTSVGSLGTTEAEASSDELPDPSSGEGPGPGPVTEAWMSGGATEDDPTTGPSLPWTSTSDATTGEPVDPLADCPWLRVTTPNNVLNVRPTPSTAQAPVATLSDGAL